MTTIGGASDEASQAGLRDGTENVIMCLSITASAVRCSRPAISRT